jgi:hypothetical protein
MYSQPTEIASLLERLSAGKPHAFNSLARKNPLDDFFDGLVVIAIERVRIKTAPAPQITSLKPYLGSLTGPIHRAMGEH